MRFGSLILFPLIILSIAIHTIFCLVYMLLDGIPLAIHEQFLWASARLPQGLKKLWES